MRDVARQDDNPTLAYLLGVKAFFVGLKLGEGDVAKGVIASHPENWAGNF